MPFVYDAGTSNPGGVGLIEYGGVRVNNGSYILTALGGLVDTPAIRTTSTPSGEGHGAYLSNPFYDAREITVEGFVLVERLDELWPACDKLKGAFNLATTALRTLWVNQIGWAERRFVSARPSGPLVFADPGVGAQRQPRREFQIPLVAPDPRIYGETLWGAGTYPDPRQDDHTFTGLTTYAHPNVGTFPAPITWIVNGPVTDPALVNNDNGRYIQYRGAVGSTQQLVVSSLARTATLDGANVYYNIERFDDMSLAPGANNLRRGSAATGFTSAARWVVQYRDAWV